MAHLLFSQRKEKHVNFDLWPLSTKNWPMSPWVTVNVCAKFEVLSKWCLSPAVSTKSWAFTQLVPEPHIQLILKTNQLAVTQSWLSLVPVIAHDWSCQPHNATHQDHVHNRSPEHQTNFSNIKTCLHQTGLLVLEQSATTSCQKHKTSSIITIWQQSAEATGEEKDQDREQDESLSSRR